MRQLEFAAVLRVVAMLATLAFASSAHAHAGHHVAPRKAGHPSLHVAANARSSAAPSERHALSRLPVCPGETSGTCSCGAMFGTPPQPLPAFVAARAHVRRPHRVEVESRRRSPDLRHDTSLIVAATHASRAPPLLLP